MPAYVCIFALACLVASTAATACEPYTLNDTTWEDVNSTYCQGVVTWPVVKGEGKLAALGCAQATARLCFAVH